MKSFLFQVSCIFLFCLSAAAQVNDNKIRLSVLKKGIVGHTFVFGKWTTDGNTETHLKYLGSVTTTKGKTYKLLTSIWYWGLSHRATSRILIYSASNRYIGEYNVGSVYDLPDKLTNGNLLFHNDDNPNCDKYTSTAITLTGGLPKHIFIKCKRDEGDLYDLTSTN
ncbi:hypothetical protein EWM62_01210 [Mucilaginibacter terrigena]|uniref:Uncharacterized protein n=1 Tax=Mucilaginibacter terrigena TaxID=2492395 RepID=A0A4Q5LRW2_9SPHI|nr:hypothetical protein [Mucilaginibacter terrigena]RYU92089.1 hypothetical protein EWM62_01210 [Mucilaginibacter terrigena]